MSAFTFGANVRVAFVTALGLVACGEHAAEGERAEAPSLASPLGAQTVDALDQRYGVHPGFRANHAKGVVVQGSFRATRAAAELSRSPIFSGERIPVIARFSDAGGSPSVSDAAHAARPHGMSIKFQLPDGRESDIVANSLHFFTVATPEEFRDLQLAAAASPPGTPSPTALERFVASHPRVDEANATVGTPASFAEEEYFGIDAFVFVDASDRRQPFRYVISPERVVHLDEAHAASMAPSFLMDELPRRLSQRPATFHLRAQLAAPGDPTNDATQPWPDDRPVVDLGVLTIDRVVADSDVVQRTLLFLPGRLTEGIEPSDDPLIAARDAAYLVSFQRRLEASEREPSASAGR